MSKDGYLPDGVTHQMIEDHFGGPEDEGTEVDLVDGRIAVVLLDGAGNLSIMLYDPDDDDLLVESLNFDLGAARVLSSAISERVM